MGTKITLNETFTAQTGRLLKPDPVMPATGAVFLLDFGHSQGILAAPPNTGDVLKNIAWQDALALHGSGTEAQLSCKFTGANGGANAGGTARELTSKGALHVAASQTFATAENGRELFFGTALKAYLDARLDAGDEFYMSMWMKNTRTYVHSSSGWIYAGLAGIAGGNHYGIAFGQGETRVWNGASYLHGGAYNTLGNFHLAANSVGWRTDTGPFNLDGQIFSWGNTGFGYGAVPFRPNYPDANMSIVLYRIYLENLTASGRTGAQVDAIEHALYDAAFAEGGRFYNDTNTAPATLLGE